MLYTRDYCCLLCPIVHPAQPFSPRVELLRSQFTRVYEGGSSSTAGMMEVVGLFLCPGRDIRGTALCLPREATGA